MKPFFVYMLECRDHSFYVGQTDDLEQRIAQHEAGLFDGHTAARRPVRLVWSAELEERDEAFRVEMQLKGWSRAKKRALIEGDWALLKKLARGPDRVHARPSTPGAPGARPTLRTSGGGRVPERNLPEDPVSSFDSGPACGGPYAQDEREGTPIDHPTAEPPARPERSGREAPAESKGAICTKRQSDA